MLNKYLDSIFVLWVVGVMCGVCEYAARVLQEEATGTKNALNVNSTQLVIDSQEMLRVCKGAAKLGIM